MAHRASARSDIAAGEAVCAVRRIGGARTKKRPSIEGRLADDLTDDDFCPASFADFDDVLSDIEFGFDIGIRRFAV